MNSEKLYQVIKNLSDKEAKEFLKWGRSLSNRKSSPKYVLLFRRFRQTSGFDEARIRRGLFNSSSHFTQEKTVLITRIVEFRAGKKDASGNRLNFIETALECQAHHLAQDIFEQEFEKAYAEGAIPYCNYLVDLAEVYAEKFKVRLADQISPHPDQIRLEYNALRECLALFGAARKALKQPVLKRKSLTRKIHSLLERPPSIHSAQLDFHRQKLRIMGLTLEQKHASAFQAQVDLVNEMLTTKPPFVDPVRRLKELSSGIIAALWKEDKDNAMRFSTALTRTEPTNPYEAALKEKFWILRTVEVGYAFLEADFLAQGMEMLNANKDLLSPEEYVSKLYRAAYAYMELEAWAQARTCLRQIKKVPKSRWGELSWQPGLLSIAVSYFSDNLHEDWDRLSRPLRRSLQKESFEYPAFLLRIFHKLIKAELSPSHILARGQVEFEKLIKNPDEERQSYFFDFDDFAQAILSDTSMGVIRRGRFGENGPQEQSV